MFYLHVGPGPRVGELVDICISHRESLQGLLRFSVIIQRRLPFNEVGKSRFQFCSEERMNTQRQRDRSSQQAGFKRMLAATISLYDVQIF